MQPQATRRSFLKYVGYGAASLTAAAHLGPLTRSASAQAGKAGEWVSAQGVPAFAPVAYPLPLPSDAPGLAPAATRLATYTVVDDLLLPEGWRYDIVAQWGDRFGDVVFGTGADFTGLIPVAGSDNEFWLIVNHEYVSGRPWLQGAKEVHGEDLVDADGKLAGQALMGLSLNLLNAAGMRPELLAGARKICQAAMRDLGVSVLRVRRNADHSIEVIKDSPDHFRIHAFGATNVPDNAMHFTGPASGLLGKPRGTYSNCSGGVTPWGTFLSCEENFQDQAPEFITPAGTPLPGDRKDFLAAGSEHPTNLPFEFEGLGTGIEPPLDGRDYGWVIEVDPVKRTMKKHTMLGRFRHENVAIRAEAGKKLVAYMGDDRRGGHVWKFVSADVVTDPKSPDNSLLLERGTLYAAKFDADFTGRWIPLVPETPLARPEPEKTAGGHVWLPYRPGGGHIAVGDGKARESSVRRWIMEIEMYTGRPYDQLTLGDLLRVDLAGARAELTDLLKQTLRQGVLCMDAYVMANAAGATPTARPEDIEVHPVDQSVYIAFTDSTGSGDGSPDARIFPDSAGENSRQYGAIYRIAEKDNDPAAETFTWGNFVASGETFEHGGGFACADNLVFDPEANLWMVCDITTPRHNTPVTRSRADSTQPGGSGFVGIFGNNAMFCIPTAGEQAGRPICFAIGPMECELTGPTFTDDGQTLILSVQHPGELHGTRGREGVDQPLQEQRSMKLADAEGNTFEQQRTVPLGSNFPAGKSGAVPKACVLAIRRG